MSKESLEKWKTIRDLAEQLIMELHKAIAPEDFDVDLKEMFKDKMGDTLTE